LRKELPDLFVAMCIAAYAAEQASGEPCNFVADGLAKALADIERGVTPADSSRCSET
jgi:hypothetical protein